METHHKCLIKFPVPFCFPLPNHLPTYLQLFHSTSSPLPFSSSSLSLSHSSQSVPSGLASLQAVASPYHCRTSRPTTTRLSGLRYVIQLHLPPSGLQHSAIYFPLINTSLILLLILFQRRSTIIFLVWEVTSMSRT